MENRPLGVIVGMGSQLSLAIARRFAQEGFNLALIARSADKLFNYASMIPGAKVAGFPVDIADLGEYEDTLQQIQRRLGDPQVLIYNAASIRQGVPTNLDMGELLNDFKVNVGGAILAAQQFSPAMRRKHRGTILFTGGGLALNPNPLYSSLAIGKASIRNLAYSLGAELESDGIHVATITIQGLIREGTHFDPAKIAEVYWHLHTQNPKEVWDREILYDAHYRLS